MSILKKKKEKSRKIDKKFVTYNGYVPELNIVCTDGMYFKMYEPLFENYDADEIRNAFSLTDDGFRAQIICHDGRIRILFGKQVDDFDEAASVFPSGNELLRECSFEEWFSLMGSRLIFDDSIPKLPLNKKRKPKRKATMLGQVMPFNVKSCQKTMEISGQTTKTVMLTQYPDQLFSAFTTELLDLSPRFTVSVHIEQMDPELCLEGINLASGQRAARKETMKAYLESVISKGTKLYNVCYFVSMSGLPGEVEDLYQKLQIFCNRYLLGISELDFQQMNAFKSTLPMLKKRIEYNRVIGEGNLGALLPWSELSDSKKASCYGEDVIGGVIYYDRMIRKEDGFILSSDYDWSIEQAQKEISDYIAYDPVVKEKIKIIVRNEFDVGKCFGVDPQKKKTIRISLVDSLSPELYKSAVILWAIRIRSVNGHITRSDYMDIMKAADIPTGDQFLERFMSGLDKKHLVSLNVRPFKDELSGEMWDSNYGTIYRVSETGVFEECCYMGLIHNSKGIVYSLNTELLSDNRVQMFIPSDDCMYTFLSEDNARFYNSKHLTDYMKKAPFLLIGGHKIAEKLMVSSICGLTKEERSIISDPATKKLLFTSLASYELKNN